jgi:hypothetical protein
MIPEDNGLEYCFWASDIVSAEALANFSFEKNLWEWVVRMFHHNNSNSTRTTAAAADTAASSCPPLGFLDIGVNVGDWISPIRLLLPQVPMYGIEGSPGTAAIATANFATSVRYHHQHIQQQQQQQQMRTKATTRHSPAMSMLLPFSLAMPAQMPSIRAQGGVCFSKPQYIGGRYQNNNDDK